MAEARSNVRTLPAPMQLDQDRLLCQLALVDLARELSTRTERAPLKGYETDANDQLDAVLHYLQRDLAQQWEQAFAASCIDTRR